MTKLLALETSGALCSVAIWRGEERFEDTRNVERMHNQVLLEMLDQLTENAAVAPADFDVVAFGAGPGSFTGVRIAAAVAQSVALVADAVVVPVASSRAMIEASDLDSGKVVAVTRSRGGPTRCTADGLPSCSTVTGFAWEIVLTGLKRVRFLRGLGPPTFAQFTSGSLLWRHFTAEMGEIPRKACRSTSVATRHGNPPDAFYTPSNEP